MPELPEVESVRRQLAVELTGRRIENVTASPQRRFVDLDRLAGRTVGGVCRRGKYLIWPLDAGLELVANLGMTGSFRLCDLPAPEGDHIRARLVLDDGRMLVYRDPRRFGRLTVVAAGDYAAIPTLATLGPEPLSGDFDGNLFAAVLAATRAPVKAVLLGQRAVAGVGNIYADEALWHARIHPASRRVGTERAHRLRTAIRRVLAAAVEREGTTFRDYQMTNGAAGRYAAFLEVYGKAGRPCRRCGRRLARTTVAQRGTTYCPGCQRI